MKTAKDHVERIKSNTEPKYIIIGFVIIALIVIGIVIVSLANKPAEIRYINVTVIKEVPIDRVVYVNQTVEVIKEVIKEVPGDCEVCIEPSELCDNKLTMCNIRVDEINTHLYECMITNTTEYSDNITVEYHRCNDKRERYEELITDLKNLMG